MNELALLASGSGGAAQKTYVDDVFSTYLYTGTGATQTINNGIDLAGKGGLVWTKIRSAADNHILADTARGIEKDLNSNSIAGQQANLFTIRSFLNGGYTVAQDSCTGASGQNYTSWTFRKQPKFFDVVTYTGDGNVYTNRTHSLGVVPGFVIYKRTDSTGDWNCWSRRANGTYDYVVLNSTAASVANVSAVDAGLYSDRIQPGAIFAANTNGATYVAYLFAHDAGGFGLTGSDNVISCGSYTGNGSATGPTITLGYEPQWLMIKNASGVGNWNMIDNMRGMPVGSADAFLEANTSDAEATADWVSPTATGFNIVSTSSEVNTNTSTYIYIAIRRGPMKVPTSGTSVFGLSARTGTGANATVTGSAGVSDAVLIKNRGSAVGDLFASRLTGTGYLETSSTAAEVAAGTTILQANPWDVMDGVKVGTTSTITNASANTYINYLFDRAPGFFDVVCWTGDGNPKTVPHSLGVVPELIIAKRRDSSVGGEWYTGATAVGWDKVMFLVSTSATQTGNPWNNGTAPTASNFYFYGYASPYVAYLFATCAGVSKVGSYTGNGSSQTINCGFTGGARFVLIKRTDSTGDWYVWDSARGIVAANDPRLSLNTTAAEVTTDDSVDPDTTGFIVNQNAATNINVSSASYIFLAIA